MRTSTLLVLSLCVLGCALGKVYKFEKDGVKLSVDLYLEGAKISFEVPYKAVDKSFVFHLKGAGECPGYAYWFSKDNMALKALSLSSGCFAGEDGIKLKYELATDFVKREVDTVDNGVFKFSGELVYEENISKFDIDNYTKIRIIKNSQTGAREDNTYDL